MVFISAQPDDNYFLWQLEVQINNFRKFGYSDKMHVLLYKPADRDEWNPNFEEIERRYPEVKFFRYEDRGAFIKAYIPILRPHILKQHFKKYPELEKEVIFYHDSDILFTREIDFESLSKDDVWYVSDTNGYIGYEYFKSKIKDVKPTRKDTWNVDNMLKPLIQYTGATLEQFKELEGNAGGAQYLLKGVNWEFWEAIEKNCLNINLYFRTINTNFFPNEDAGIQRWCADMWAMLWCGLALGKEIKITNELAFSHATDEIGEWDKKPIYHNAGVTNEPDMFYKGKYHDNRSFPWGDNLSHVSNKWASFKYVQEIKEVANKYYVKELT
jgi:hypothetical protein